MGAGSRSCMMSIVVVSKYSCIFSICLGKCSTKCDRRCSGVCIDGRDWRLAIGKCIPEIISNFLMRLLTATSISLTASMWHFLMAFALENNK